jgi:exopolyphosphatase/guanosine-5'-triphosphate,3'-diphosphate pyrophosphatase
VACSVEVEKCPLDTSQEPEAVSDPEPELSTPAGRWEWRAFGETFGAAEDRFAALPVERVQESDELYLLSPARDATVKVRHDLMDVKRLQRVSPDGLQQWAPVMKAEFPIPAARVREVAAAMGAVVPELARTVYSLPELVEELVEPHPALHAVPVHKKRVRYTIDGCASEVTEVQAAGRETRTIALESEEPGDLLAAVRKLGFEPASNVSYPAGLAALLGIETPRCAVIDCGTNSVKFLVGELDADGTWRAVVDRAEVTRLGEGLREAGELGAEPMRRTISAIAEMADEARRNQVGAVAAVGTAGMRIARNSHELVTAVRDRCGIEIQIISGDDESRLAYRAVRSALGLVRGSLVVFDTGGGSSQFTFGRGSEVDERFSVDVGAVRFTEAFGLAETVPEEALARALDAISADLGRLDGRSAPDMLVGMGGAVTNLTAVALGLEKYDPEVVQGAVLDVAEVERQIALYAGRSADERRAIVGLQPKRAEIILAGALIVMTIMTKLGKEQFGVSDRGLRHGVLVERFGQPSP